MHLFLCLNITRHRTGQFRYFQGHRNRLIGARCSQHLCIIDRAKRWKICSNRCWTTYLNCREPACLCFDVGLSLFSESFEAVYPTKFITSGQTSHVSYWPSDAAWHENLMKGAFARPQKLYTMKQNYYMQIADEKKGRSSLFQHERQVNTVRGRAVRA